MGQGFTNRRSIIERRVLRKSQIAPRIRSQNRKYLRWFIRAPAGVVYEKTGDENSSDTVPFKGIRHEILNKARKYPRGSYSKYSKCGLFSKFAKLKIYQINFYFKD
jgi:hypothetical protein